MDIKIGVFEVADYAGVVFFRLNPLQSEKKSHFHHFWAKNGVFKKSDMGIKIGVFDGAEYGGIVYFQFKLL